ncbi:GAF domain-containing protein [bacterium]|nr:GAF domain-containing protein [bacterium]
MLHTQNEAGSLGHELRPVSALMERLAGGDGTPDLERLALGLADALPHLPGARHLAVAVDADRAFLLDSNWNRRRETCLVVSRESAPRWVALPGGWNPLAAAAGDKEHPVACGPAPVPGGAPWSVLDDAAAGPWCLLPVRVLGHIVACVVVEREPGAHEDLAAMLSAVGRAVGVVTGLWAELASLGVDLDQARSEAESLTRLNRLQGRFVAMTSHEFKTPLTSITAYTDVLRNQLTDEQFPHAREFLDVIKAEADRLLRMVNRILDFTRVEYGSRTLQREAVDLVPLVHDTVRGLQAAIQDKDLDVTVEAAPGLPRAMVDTDLIRQVLLNLLGNAVKFTPREGAVRVTVAELESAVSVTVRDTGPGIPAGDMRRVFREYYRADGTTAREEGTGLGLTIARHIVHLHGGHIEVGRPEAGGAEFRFMVPKETGAAAALPLELGPKTDPEEARTLVDELLRLVAELTGSRAVAILLRDRNGALVAAGAMGCRLARADVRPILENTAWTRFMQAGRPAVEPPALADDLAWSADASEESGRMFAPLGAGENVLGVVVAGRRREGRYDQADLVQLTVLADVIRAALQGVPLAAGRTIEAVRTLLTMRRSGVPTATPRALDLLEQVGRRLGVGEKGLRRIQYAATLHDAGMARIEEEIVYGDGQLAVDQRDEVERHVEQGMDVLAPLLPDEATAVIIRHHHERFDGGGYPDGLAGEAVPLGARLLAVIDAWFSLTRDRPFRAGLAPAAALAEIRNHAGTQFDPRIVDALAQAVAAAPQMVTTPPSGSDPAAG